MVFERRISQVIYHGWYEIILPKGQKIKEEKIQQPSAGWLTVMQRSFIIID